MADMETSLFSEVNKIKHLELAKYVEYNYQSITSFPLDIEDRPDNVHQVI